MESSHSVAAKPAVQPARPSTTILKFFSTSLNVGQPHEPTPVAQGRSKQRKKKKEEPSKGAGSIQQHLRPQQELLEVSQSTSIATGLTQLSSHGSQLDASGARLDRIEHLIYPSNRPVREYQRRIIERAIFENVLVSLPTGYIILLMCM